MNTRQKIFMRSCVRIKNTKLLEHESPVQSGLSVTPSQMLRMTEQGIAISPAAVDETIFSDNDYKNTNDFHVNVEDRRHIDINMVWETEQDIKKKFRKARKDGAFVDVEPKGGE